MENVETLGDTRPSRLILKAFFRKTYKRPRFSHLYIHENAFIQSLILYYCCNSFLCNIIGCISEFLEEEVPITKTQTHQYHQSKLTVPIPVFALKVQKCTVLQKLDYFFFGEQHSYTCLLSFSLRHTHCFFYFLLGS